MKVFEMITDPLLIIFCFAFILISGENFGGFYGMYIFIGLQHGMVHSILAVMGIILFIISKLLFGGRFKRTVEPIINLTGITFLVISIVLFFTRDREHFNYPTFYQTLPLIILCLFALLAIIFIIRNILKMLSSNPGMF